MTALNYYAVVYKYLFQTKYGYTAVTVALGSRLLSDAPRVELMY